MNGGGIPFNTQFFHDDYDDGPGFDDMDPYDGDGVGVANDTGEQDLLAATQGQTRRVPREFVKYAKRAKRVDVRKLKENIWRGLDIVVASKPKDDEHDENMVRNRFPCSRAKTNRLYRMSIKRCHPRQIHQRHGCLVK
jgi:condensin complex subunit 2